MIFKCIILASVLLLYFSQQSPFSQKNTDSKLRSALRELDSRIEAVRHRDHEMRLKFSRLFETNQQSEEGSLTLDGISIIPSISIPYKDGLFYTMMVRKNNKFFTLRGDLIYQGLSDHTFVSSVRNQYTFFIEKHRNQTLAVKKLNAIKKQFSLQIQTSLDLSSINGLTVDNVLVFYPSNRLSYVVADYQRAKIYCLDNYGSIIKQIDTVGTIVQIQKVNSNLVVMTDRELFYLNIQKNITKINCVWPEKGLQYFKFQDSTAKSIFAFKKNQVYQYNLGYYCRPIKSYQLPTNADFLITSQVMFIEAEGQHYAINFTEGILKSYTLPVSQCEGQKKYSITKKLFSQYIISRICLKKQSINIAHVLVDMETNNAEIADFSKFRIPLLILSFGMIIYVTVKNKKKEGNEDQQEKEFKDILLKKAGVRQQLLIQDENKSSKLIPEEWHAQNKNQNLSRSTVTKLKKH